MNDSTQIEQVAHAIAAAISAKDGNALRPHLTPDFVLRRPGAEPIKVEDFVDGVSKQQIETLAMQLEHLQIDLTGDAAVATGVQSTSVRVEGETLDDRQPFVNWFVKSDGRWQLRLALDFSEW